MTVVAQLLAAYLTYWAERSLARTGVRIIAVTGSVGKTTTKEAIRAVLEPHVSVRAARGNLNGPHGVALVVLGGGWDEAYYASGGGPWFWCRAALAAPFRALFGGTPEQYLILEYGADHPGDMRWLVEHFPPHVAVVTAVGQVPVHLEYYASPQHVAQEKSQLLTYLGSEDTAVLNGDDLSVLEMREKVHRGRVMTFGVTQEVDIRAAGIEILNDDNIPAGVTFTLHADGVSVQAVVQGALGRSQAMAGAAAVAVARALDISCAQAVQGLEGYRSPAGRLRIIRGIKGTTILDDTYNSSPLALHNALDTLKAAPAKRRIAIIGDMLELGDSTIRAHQEAGNMAGEIADVLICVGEKMRLAVDSAANQMKREDIHWFHTAHEAGLKAQSLLEPGDLVLVKGSQGIRMEHVVKELMAEPERAAQQLVRQGSRWLRR